MARPCGHRTGAIGLPIVSLGVCAESRQQPELRPWLTDEPRIEVCPHRPGKTNAEIAADLFVGEGTVKTHINHVFAKLQLRDRAAAVVFAFDHDLASAARGRPVRDRLRGEVWCPAGVMVPRDGPDRDAAAEQRPNAHSW